MVKLGMEEVRLREVSKTRGLNWMGREHQIMLGLDYY